MGDKTVSTQHHDCAAAVHKDRKLQMQPESEPQRSAEENLFLPQICTDERGFREQIQKLMEQFLESQG
jgi:hypothetical protein